MEISNSRQFHVHPSLVGDEAVCVPIGELYRQMHTVLRLAKGDAVRFFDGMGNVAEGRIAHINKDGILVPIDARYAQTRKRNVTLAISILKNDRLKFVLEKATELGVASIVPMITERVVKRPASVPPRWNHIVREAAEQSGRAWLPTIQQIQSFKEVVSRTDHKIVCAVGAEEPLPPATSEHPHIVMIGPEGGFTEQEIDFALAQGADLHSLGDFQLRADTAALIALARM